MKPLESFCYSQFLLQTTSQLLMRILPQQNSFNTKQLLSGSKLFKVVFGIKNILLIIFVYFILFTSSLNAKNCLSFLPYGFNESYVHLPQSVSFCVRRKNS